MPLTRMGGSAFDLERVVAVVRHQDDDDHVTVYLGDAVAVELAGDDAHAFLRFVASLPTKEGEELGPVGSRVAVVRAGGPKRDEPSGRKRGG